MTSYLKCSYLESSLLNQFPKPGYIKLSIDDDICVIRIKLKKDKVHFDEENVELIKTYEVF